VDNFHGYFLLTPRTITDVRRGEGREKRKSDTRAQRQQSTVPVEPSTTMLTYRLTSTTEDSGSTTTNPTSLAPTPHDGQHDAAESSRTMVRQGTKAPLC